MAGLDGTGPINEILTDPYFRGGADVEVLFRITAEGSVWVFLGTAAPTDDTGSVIVPGDGPPLYLQAEQQLWIKRVGGSNLDASVEFWEIIR